MIEVASISPPKRFKMFKEDWKEKKLGDLTTLLKDGTHGTHNDVNDGPFLLSAKNLKNGKVVYDHSDRKISYDDYNQIYKNYQLQENDILLSIVGTIGRVALANNVESIAFQRSVAIIRFKDFIYPKYIYQLLNTNSFQMQLLKKQVVSAQPGIYLGDLSKLHLYYPSIKEQQKIADFFTLLDRRIEKQQEKVEALRDYKKGMLQKIFSRELRFKDENGDDFAEWEYKKLKDYLVQYTEKTTASNQYPALTSSRRGLYLQSDYFNKQIASDDNTGYNIVPYGYFTYRHMSDDTTFFFNINLLVENGIVSTLYPVFTTTKDMNSNFLKQLLNHGSDFKRYSILQKQGGSRTYMYFSKLVEFATRVPCIKEQQKIADFLSKLDKKIEKEEAKLEALQEQKKGFMQQMFI